MGAKKQSVAQRFNRPGEGVVMGDIRQDLVDGVMSQTFSVDVSNAQVPDRRYAAEVAAIVMSDNMVRLLFGQTKPIGKGLSSMLVIHIPYRAARTFINSMKILVDTARAYMEQYKVESSSLLELKNQEEPAQTATVEANIIIGAFSGREACMDFYHASPFAMGSAGNSGKLHADPTVRVTLGLPLMMAVFDWLESHKNELPVDALENEL